MAMEKPTTLFARSLRRRMTPPELRLWGALRGRKVQSLKVRRQHPMGPYVLDFYCEQARLAVEVDGESHWRGNQQARDERRDAWLAGRGIETLRIEAIAVRDDLDGVIERIVATAEARMS